MDRPVKYTVTPPPYVKSHDTVTSMTADVLIALLPATILAVFTFGLRALTMIAVSVASCVAFEWLWTKLRRVPLTLGDLSCVVTGVLLAFMMPAAAPVWLPVIGAAFAVIVVKQLFGGLGKNLFNPALAGYVFLLLLFPQQMTGFTQPRVSLPVFANAQAVTVKTPLMILHDGSAVGIDLWQLVLGQHAGALGETATIALLAGGVYLLWRRVLKWRIPLAFIAVTALAALVFPQGGLSGVHYMAAAVCGGTLLLGAIFMATDSVTSPVAPAAQWVYGAGCGLLTVLIRYRGSFPDGVAFAILMMNALAWLLDKHLHPRDNRCMAEMIERLRARLPGGRRAASPAADEPKAAVTQETVTQDEVREADRESAAEESDAAQDAQNGETASADGAHTQEQGGR